MKLTAVRIAISCVALSVGALQAAAQSTFVNQAWEGHKTSAHCFAISFPVKERAEGQSYLTVTNRFQDRIQDEVGVVSGYGAEANIEGSIQVDDKQPLKMVVYQGTGYLKSTSLERDIVRQMRAGKELQVKWTLESGEYVVDKYSLFGFTAANNFAKDCK